VHFINYYDIAPTAGIQFADVEYRNQAVTRVGNSANGLFGSSYTFAVTPLENAFFTPNQFLCTTVGNDAIYAMPEDSYGIAWATTGDHLHINTNPYNNPTGGLWFFSNAVSSTGATPFGEAWTKYTVVPPASGSLQAQPHPCCKWETETITLTGTSVLIPSQSVTPITFHANFTLTKPLLLAETRTTSTPQNVDFLFVDTNKVVKFDLVGPSPNYSMEVRSSSDVVLGFLILTLGSNLGFTTNSFSPTLVSEYNFPT